MSAPDLRCDDCDLDIAIVEHGHCVFCGARICDAPEDGDEDADVVVYPLGSEP